MSPVHPGELLLEAINDRGWTQAEFARRCDLSTKHVNRIIKGASLYSPDMAVRFERVTGISARFWLGAKAEYQMELARQRGGMSLADL